MKGGIFFFLFFIFYSPLLPAQRSIDSAAAVAVQKDISKQAYISACFFIADEYMNIEQYDSAQLWLNKIHEVLPVKSVSLDNYFLLTRQAEVYYYNNLQQLGLQESRRGLAMAEALNDSLLLADSYNFLGLFYMNTDSAAAAIPFYKKGLQFTRQPPYPLQYLSLSKPHHLHGNLAEAYYKLGIYDSAVFHNRLSLEKATAIKWERGIAVAHTGLGDVFLALQKGDSALLHFIPGVNTALHSGDIDVALICYGGMARAHQLLHQPGSVGKSLADGFNLLSKHPNINRFYALHFLNTAVAIYRRENDQPGLIKALEMKSAVEKANIDGSNKQIQTILKAGMTNEKRILTLEVDEAKRKQQLANTRLLMALAGFALLAIGFLVYRYYQNQKLALLKIRQKISQDLHDDIGASLSSLQIYGAIAEQSVLSNPQKTLEMVQKISGQSKEIMENMNDIVWSMKTNDYGGTTLETKIKNYAAELLQDRQIDFSFVVQPQAEMALQSMKARRNLLLIIREIVNNAAKYSKATRIVLHIYIQDKSWIMDIADNGTGMDTNRDYSGNGLKNIRQRCAELNGTCTVDGQAGTKYLFVFPITVITDTGW